MTESANSQVIRRAGERGFADHGWLRSYHSFSFADYFDPEHIQFGALRVINEDRIAPGAGFGTHSHRDMEIISYVLEGELAHKDSMGHGSVIRPGDVQRMTAGTGVQHSEFNNSKEASVHFLQIWIVPDQVGIEPGYEERHFTTQEKQGALRLIASSDGREGSVLVHQDASIYALILNDDEAVEYAIAENRRACAHVARGALTINGRRLGAGDALLVEKGLTLAIGDAENAELLLFDLAL